MVQVPTMSNMCRNHTGNDIPDPSFKKKNRGSGFDIKILQLSFQHNMISFCFYTLRWKTFKIVRKEPKNEIHPQQMQIV